MSMMNEVCFYDLVDVFQQQVEDVFDDSDLDFDLENVGGVFIVCFENGLQLIFSCQVLLCQLWVVVKLGGFYFDYDEVSGFWCYDGSQELLGVLFNWVILEQGGEDVEFFGF